MQILKYSEGPEAGLQKLIDRLTTELASDKRVLWFLTGGSGIYLCVQAMAQINDEQSKNLTLALGDERYGPLGHPNSNWQQLTEAGFNPKSAQTVSILQGNLGDMYAAATAYAQVLHDLFATSDVVVGQYGMGADGHIAGILPDSLAATAEDLVSAYHGPDFERITTTFDAIKHCDVAFLFAEGDQKRQALENLEHTVPLLKQPAQILKQLPEAYVFNDQIGEPI